MVTVSPPDTWVYALRLPLDPRAARVARMTVRAALNGHGMREALDVVELLMSELVTNAYRHTKGPASLRLTALGDGRLRVGVWDTSPIFPPPSASLPVTASGLPPWMPSAGAGRSSCRSTPIPGPAGPSVTACSTQEPGSCCGSKLARAGWAGGRATGAIGGFVPSAIGISPGRRWQQLAQICQLPSS